MKPSESIPQILIVDDEEEIRELIAFSIEAEFGLKALEAKEGREAIDLISSNPNLLMIICDQNMPNAKGTEVFSHLNKIGHSAKFVFCSSDLHSDHPDVKGANFLGWVVKPKILEPVLGFVRSALSLTQSVPTPSPTQLLPSGTPQSQSSSPRAGRESLPALPTDSNLAELTPPNFCRIRAKTLLKFRTLERDIFLPLSGSKQVRVFQAGQSFDRSDYDHYLKKGVHFFLVKREDSPIFLERLANDVHAFSAIKQGINRRALVASMEVLDSIHEIFHQIGVDEQVRKLSDDCIQLSLDTLGSEESISQLLGNGPIEIDNYLACHSIMTAQVACGIASQLGWGDRATLYQLSLASFLHDLSLTHDDLAKIQSLQEIEKGALLLPIGKADARRLVLSHPERSASFAQVLAPQFEQVATVLRQHHEKPDGSGFPLGLGVDQLDPLSLVFLIAHEIVTTRLNSGNSINIEGFLADFAAKYPYEPIRKILKGLASA